MDGVTGSASTSDAEGDTGGSSGLAGRGMAPEVPGLAGGRETLVDGVTGSASTTSGTGSASVASGTEGDTGG